MDGSGRVPRLPLRRLAYVEEHGAVGGPEPAVGLLGADSGPKPPRPQVGEGGRVEGVVHGDDVAALRVQQGGGDGGAHPASRSAPTPCRRAVRGAAAQQVQRMWTEPRYVPGGPLGGAAHVEDDGGGVRASAAASSGEAGRGGRSGASRRGAASRPGCRRRPQRGGRRRRASSRWASASRAAESARSDRPAPGDQPGQVGGECAVGLDVVGAGQVAFGEGDAAAQVDDPLAGGEPGGDLVGVRPRGRGEVDGGRARGIQGTHVGVVGGDVVEGGEEVGDEGVGVLGEGVVGGLLGADGGGAGAVGAGGGAEAAEAVGGQDGGVVGEFAGEPVRGGVLVAGEPLGEAGLDEVGAADGADQQRAAGEGGDRGCRRPPGRTQCGAGVWPGVARARSSRLGVDRMPVGIPYGVCGKETRASAGTR